MKQFLWVLLSTILLAMLSIYLLQRRLIYFPAMEVPSRQAFHAQDMQAIQLKTRDGLSLLSWYYPANPHQSTILILHGNGGHIGYRMPLVRAFIKEGFGVLLLEYRGYGGNPGSPSEQGLYQDGQAALNFLHEKGIDNKNIVLYGESLGTAVATYLAKENKVCAVILQSPFTSLSVLARIHYPWILLPPWDKFDSLARIKSINTALLILHGNADSIVPFQEGLTLYQQANEPKKWIELAGRGHNNMWDSNYYDYLIQFISLYCSGNSH